jgi:hypothetical protein
MAHKLIKTTDYILVVDDSLTIGKGYAVNRDYEIMKYNTDEHLAYDSYAVKKIIAHLPLNGSPILEGVDLLPPYSRHQEDGLDDAVIRFKESYSKLGVTDFELSAFSVGYLQAREKYRLTLSKLIDLYVNETGYGMDMWSKEEDETMSTIAKIIQPLHQYPTEFETEDVLTPSQIFYPNDVPYSSPKTIITAQGVQWVGKYK